MSAFNFVSHESYPEDEYTKEAVVLCIEKQHRVTYVRKQMKNGGMFWDVISVAVKQNGEKKYLKAYSQDSNFLAEDIKHYLENRSWEQKPYALPQVVRSGGIVAQKDDEVPF
jgi:hypothetical protein